VYLSSILLTRFNHSYLYSANASFYLACGPPCPFPVTVLPSSTLISPQPPNSLLIFPFMPVFLVLSHLFWSCWNQGV